MGTVILVFAFKYLALCVYIHKGWLFVRTSKRSPASALHYGIVHKNIFKVLDGVVCTIKI